MQSPFSDAPTVLPAQTKRKGNGLLWGLIGSILLLIVGIGGYLLYSHLNDPLRTLEVFPVAKYLEGYKSLQGSRFKGELTVENDLGFKDGTGRLMTFSTKESTHPVVVMIPQSLSGIYFVKGQHYLAELEVKEGGLIYANSCRKN
jgi:hypothetical protein